MEMYEPMVLFYVGVVLIINGLSMLDYIEDRECLIINALVGCLFLRIVNELAFGIDLSAKSITQATCSLMFAFTYIWIAYNKWSKRDGRGLGWFSVIVAVTAMFVSVHLFASANEDTWALWGAISWGAWSVLWGMFFLIQVVKISWVRITAWMSIVQGLLTGWMPAMLLMKL